MPTIRILDTQVIDSAKLSRSYEIQNVEPNRSYSIVPDFSRNAVNPLADPNFWFIVKLFKEMDPSHDMQCIGSTEWVYGGNVSACTGSGIARRLRGYIETSYIVTAGLDLVF